MGNGCKVIAFVSLGLQLKLWISFSVYNKNGYIFGTIAKNLQYRKRYVTLDGHFFHQ